MGEELDGGNRPENAVYVLVNESFVKRFWPGIQPVGRNVFGMEVIGLVKDAKILNLGDEPKPRIFFQKATPDYLQPCVLVAASGASDSLVSNVRRRLRELEPNVKIIAPKALEKYIKTMILNMNPN